MVSNCVPISQGRLKDEKGRAPRISDPKVPPKRQFFLPKKIPKSKRLGGDLLIEFVLGPARSTDSQWVP